MGYLQGPTVNLPEGNAWWFHRFETNNIFKHMGWFLWCPAYFSGKLHLLPRLFIVLYGMGLTHSMTPLVRLNVCFLSSKTRFEILESPCFMQIFKSYLSIYMYIYIYVCSCIYIWYMYILYMYIWYMYICIYVYVYRQSMNLEMSLKKYCKHFLSESTTKMPIKTPCHVPSKKCTKGTEERSEARCATRPRSITCGFKHGETN